MQIPFIIRELFISGFTMGLEPTRTLALHGAEMSAGKLLQRELLGLKNLNSHLPFLIRPRSLWKVT